MKLIDFTRLGGYRLEQPTLAKMQESYYFILEAFIKYLQVPAVGNFIISGCDIVGPNITSGICYIDGELCGFIESPGTLASKIKKIESFEDLSFFNGTNPPIFRSVSAVVDPTGVLLSDFVRVKRVIDDEYVHTENNFSDAWVAFLMTIEVDAQKNVQADLDEIDNTKDTYVKGKPPGKLLSYLHKGTINIGNPTTNDFRTITFPSVGTTSYMVVGSLVSNSVTYDVDNDVFWIISNKTATSFKLGLREIDDVTQDLNFDYCLIPL